MDDDFASSFQALPVDGGGNASNADIQNSAWSDGQPSVPMQATGTEPSTDPGYSGLNANSMQSYLSMLGFPGAGTPNPQTQAASVPGAQMPMSAAGGASPGLAGMLPAWLGLGVSGQKAQQMPVVYGAPTAYQLPANLQPQQKSSSGGGGMGGILGGFL